ncbi:hypothetical protein F2Q70_00023613 [Brassica cretica]|uniref:holo-[acyl-carrier-protein] synthase n=1 Tax=Brassica cretica TaxID=69181 RepID=A0A8S9GPT6_BRACR|nr:hypothetical protein F2Q70_00023613 [Brassica cretica]
MRISVMSQMHRSFSIDLPSLIPLQLPSRDELKKNALLARTLVRTTIARYQTNKEVDPRSLMFKKNMYGKPEVDWQNCKNCNNQPLHFNISHTDSLIACGVTVHVPVGIDVEDKERKIKHDVLAFAKRFYSADEVNFLATIRDPEKQKETIPEI